MAKKTVLDTLRKAKKLLQKHWIEGDFAENKAGESVSPRSPEAVNFCSIGAMRHVDGPGEAEAMKFLRRAAKRINIDNEEHGSAEATNSAIIHVNDSIGKPAVMDMFQLAIELAKE